jgi:hypothetical protein
MQTLQMLRFNKASFLRKQKVRFVWEEHHSLKFQKYYRTAGVAQSVQRLATGWTTEGSKFGFW